MPQDTAARPSPVVTEAGLRTAFPIETDHDFIEEVIEDYRAEELPGVSTADLAAVLADFWRHCEETRGGPPAMRLIEAKGEGGRDLNLDVLEIAQSDAPFLVDSIMGEVADAGAEVKAMFHPVIERGADRRSMIQVWLAPLSRERRRRLLERVGEAVADVWMAVNDWPAMQALMGRTIAELEAAAPGDPGELAEDLEFLKWMDGGHFVFLGARCYEYPRTAEGGYAAEEPLIEPEGSLGVLRDRDRAVLRRANEPAVLSAALRRRLEAAEPLVVAKSNLRSRVHRRAYMDYVGVRRYGPDGKPGGEVRFVGLFTAEAYNEPAAETPLLRRKVERVMTRAGFSKGGHNAIRLANILETYPRDELFQMRGEELLATALDILHLSDRPKVKLFVRHDPFDRFVSVLFYAPRERYDTRLRQRAGDILAAAYGGRVTAYFRASPTRRWRASTTSSRSPPKRHLDPEIGEVEERVARAARTWTDDLEEGPSALSARRAPGWTPPWPPGAKPCSIWLPRPLRRRRRGPPPTLPPSRPWTRPGRGGWACGRSARRATSPSALPLQALPPRQASPAPLAGVLPILEDMGLSALVEEGYELNPALAGGDIDHVWVHEFLLEDERGDRLGFAAVKDPFEATFKAVWNGEAESDALQSAWRWNWPAPWREGGPLLRALARYRAQSGLDPSQAVQEAALSAHPELARLILELFHVRFDPAAPLKLSDRAARAGELQLAIEEALQAVDSLDADRALRRMAALVQAMTRTNYFQTDAAGAAKPYISFKLASRELAELPAPKPFAEIFVASPVVEATHLRMGPVARGGIRWSDRRDDFRTEILGLVKAQQVKNAVIVPVGAKGGFYPKVLPPRGASAEAVRVEAVRAYRTFLSGLLDITDSLNAANEIVHPADTVIHDGDDPYLVVAADKGTASFSDIANWLKAADYGFWLGDAFAFGRLGKEYDHTRPWRSPPGAPGRQSSATSANSARTSSASRSRWWGSATCPATCSATACCCRGRSGCAPRSTIATCSSIPIPIPPSRSPSASACSTFPLRRGTTTTAA